MAIDPIVAVLIKRRKALRLSQRRLSEQTGVHQSSISEYECGHSTMTLVTLRKICAAMHIRLYAVAPPTDELEARWAE